MHPKALVSENPEPPAGVDLMFYVYGVMGLLWLALWEPFVSTEPPLLRDHRLQASPPQRLSEFPWGKVDCVAMFLHRCAWPP